MTPEVHGTYALTWDLYPDHLRQMLQGLLTSGAFADVTLVADDRKFIKAHRNILSACSPVFKDILEIQKQNNHPVIYLRGMQSAEIEAIVEFIYLGETKFNENRIDEFLSIALNLQIKELCEKDAINPDLKSAHDEKANMPDTKPVIQKSDHFLEIENHDQDKHTILRERSVVDGKFKFQCPTCDKWFPKIGNLYRHIRTVHNGIRPPKFSCSQCDYEYTRKDDLTHHIQATHEGIRKINACTQCNFESTRQEHLTEHIQAKHDGIKFKCEHCDYQGSKGSLRSHVSRMHESRSIKHES